jgi:hypothetical protein
MLKNELITEIKKIIYPKGDEYSDGECLDKIISLIVEDQQEENKKSKNIGKMRSQHNILFDLVDQDIIDLDNFFSIRITRTKIDLHTYFCKDLLKKIIGLKGEISYDQNGIITFCTVIESTEVNFILS